MTGPGLTTLGMVLRFVAAPAATAVGALLIGLRGDVLRVAIIQVLLIFCCHLRDKNVSLAKQSILFMLIGCTASVRGNVLLRTGV